MGHHNSLVSDIRAALNDKRSEDKVVGHLLTLLIKAKLISGLHSYENVTKKCYYTQKTNEIQYFSNVSYVSRRKLKYEHQN